MGRNIKANRKYRYPQLGIRWRNEVLDTWHELAKDTFKREGGKLGRNVLQQFLACYIPDDKLEEFGWYEELHVGPSLLMEAIRVSNAKREPQVLATKAR